jgi:hypothetical protein
VARVLTGLADAGRLEGGPDAVKVGLVHRGRSRDADCLTGAAQGARSDPDLEITAAPQEA